MTAKIVNFSVETHIHIVKLQNQLSSKYASNGFDDEIIVQINEIKTMSSLKKAPNSTKSLLRTEEKLSYHSSLKDSFE